MALVHNPVSHGFRFNTQVVDFLLLFRNAESVFSTLFSVRSNFTFCVFSVKCQKSMTISVLFITYARFWCWFWLLDTILLNTELRTNSHICITERLADSDIHTVNAAVCLISTLIQSKLCNTLCVIHCCRLSVPGVHWKWSLLELLAHSGMGELRFENIRT